MKHEILARFAAAVMFVISAGAGSVQAEDAAPSVETLPIAVQMYTLRNSGTLSEQLTIVQSAGLNAVEIVGTHGVNADTLKGLLDARGLEVISAHVELDELRENLDAVVDFNRALGNHTIIVPYLSRKDRPLNARGWTQLGNELEILAGELEREDFLLGYHNHDFELVEFDGRTGLELIFEAAPNVLVQLDVGWIDRAGYDPGSFLSRFEGRLFAIHAKDTSRSIMAMLQGGWAPVGDGHVDWGSVLRATRAAGVEWYIIEHDNPLDGATAVTKSAEFLRRALNSSQQSGQ